MARKALQLLVDSDANAPPDDIAYTYSGYAPITVRLVEHATKAGCSWAQVHPLNCPPNRGRTCHECQQYVI